MKYFFTVSEYCKKELKIKRSTFIAHLRKAETIKDAKEFITEISKEYKTANHNCWAYAVGKKGEIFHSSDAGEPSGTAGQPMLNALKKKDLSNIAAVVTRYFGGVKLGVRGLIEAYSASVESAISEATLQKLVEIIEYKFSTTYEMFEILKYNLKGFEAEILETEFTDKVIMKISVEKHKKMEPENYLKQLSDSGKIEFL